MQQSRLGPHAPGSGTGPGEALSYVFAHLFAAFLLLKRGVSVVVLFLVGAVVAPVVTDVRVEGGGALADLLGEGGVDEVWGEGGLAACKVAAGGGDELVGLAPPGGVFGVEDGPGVFVARGAFGDALTGKGVGFKRGGVLREFFEAGHEGPAFVEDVVEFCG